MVVNVLKLSLEIEKKCTTNNVVFFFNFGCRAYCRLEVTVDGVNKGIFDVMLTAIYR